MISDDEVRRRYGSGAVVSRTGDFVLVHLDHPDAERVRERTRSFDPKEYFDEDCPLCALQRATGIYVFDDFPDEAEEILLE